MKQLDLSKKTMMTVFSKIIYFVALIYMLYFVACSIVSMLGLLTNGVDSINALILLTIYVFVILFGMFVSFFKFRFDFVFIFALLIQVVF